MEIQWNMNKLILLFYVVVFFLEIWDSFCLTEPWRKQNQSVIHHTALDIEVVITFSSKIPLDTGIWIRLMSVFTHFPHRKISKIVALRYFWQPRVVLECMKTVWTSSCEGWFYILSVTWLNWKNVWPNVGIFNRISTWLCQVKTWVVEVGNHCWY